MAETKKTEKIETPFGTATYTAINVDTLSGKIHAIEVVAFTSFSKNLNMQDIRKSIVEMLNSFSKDMTPDERKELRSQLKERLERFKWFSEAIFNEVMASTSGW